jgi:hypothetical protein
MIRKLIKYSLSIALLLTLFAGCVSIRKEGASFILELKTISPESSPGHAMSPQAAAADHASSTATLYDMSAGQARPLNSPPSQIRNRTTLSWTAPTTNEDATPLLDLEGYKIYYAQTQNYPGTGDRKQILIPRKSTSITLYNFAAGTWCFEVTAYDASRNESGFSNRVCENIP